MKSANIHFRLFRDFADYDAIAALYTASIERDQTDPHSLLVRPQQAAEIANLAQWLGRPTERLLLAEVDQSIVGYQVIGEWMNERGDWSYIHRGLVHPEWRGRGIGTALLAWAEEHLKALAASHPTNGKAKFAGDAGASPEASTFLLNNGYQEAWCLAELRCTSIPPLVPSPTGIMIRPARPEDHLALWRADNQIFGQTGELDRNIPPRFDPQGWLVACAGTELVGYCRFERQTEIGAIPVLGVLPEWRQRGIGRALLSQAMQLLTEQSIRTAHTIGDANHGFPISPLYQALGFEIVREQTWYSKPVGSDHTVFTWPTSEQIDIGGRFLSITRAGSGNLTVIFDAGGDAVSLVWRHVLPRVASYARVLTYDRAGLGQSEPGPLPRSARTATDDLRAILAATGIPGPYLLVGHSMGGLHMRLFASLYPEDIIGLVLVDAPHEDLLREWQHVLPADIFDHFVHDASYEGGNFEHTRAQLIAAPSLPDVPVVVLTARHGDYPYGWPREALDEIRVRLQHQVARSIPQGRQQIIDQTGHTIHQDRPEVVLEAIESVIALYRENKEQIIATICHNSNSNAGHDNTMKAKGKR